MDTSMDNRNNRNTQQNNNSNLMDLPSSTLSLESGQVSNYPSSHRHPHSQAFLPPPALQSYSHLQAGATPTTSMIGTSAAFYDDKIHGPGVFMSHDTEQDQMQYSTYLASFQQHQPLQQTGGYSYPASYPSSHLASDSLSHTQSYTQPQPQPQPQYLPTPGVSPTTTSPPNLIPPPRQGKSQRGVEQVEYYASNAMSMDAGSQSQAPNMTGTNTSDRRVQGHKKTKSGVKFASNIPSTGVPSNTPSSGPIPSATKTSPTSRKRARKSIDRPASPTQTSNQSPTQGQNGQGQQQTGMQLQDDSDDDDTEERAQPLQRPPGACRYCKKLKMKCDFPPDATSCKRCKSGGHQCVVEGRKQRVGPNKREFLLAQLRQKETIIESLLRQINNPAHHTPLTLLVPNLSNVTGSASNVNGSATGTPQGAQSIQNWIAGTSVKNAGGRGGLAAFSLDKRAAGTPVDLLDDDDADELGTRRRLEDDTDGDGGDDDDDVEDTAQAPHSSSGAGKKAKPHYLPTEEAPLGLIAGLSLENNTPKKKDKDKEREGSVGGVPKEDAAGSQHHSEPRGAGATAAAVGEGTEQPPDDPSSGAILGAATNANAQIGNNAGEEENENNVGVANKSYFHPGPATDLGLRRVMVERTMPPDILVHGLVTPEDVEELFKIFYERINVFVSILDPAIHTPARTFARCPFLFTVVCAISSRYYAPKASIYKYAMHFAKSAAASSLIDGWKSVELCQAYLLMSVYAVPARRWEEDRSWLYLGLAIRIATDLNLHQPSSAAVSAVANPNANTSVTAGNVNGNSALNGPGVAGSGARHSQTQNQYPSHAAPTSSLPSNSSNFAQNMGSPSPSLSIASPAAASSQPGGTTSKSAEKQEKHERELLNRTRTWLICFNLDRSISTQLGKPSTIKEDFIIRNASEWYKRSPFNMPYDVHLCAYTELLRIVTRFHDDVWSGSRTVGGANVKGGDVDFYTITMRYDDQLRLFQEQAAARFERDSKKDDPGSVYRTELLPFMVNYSRLVMFSFGFQQAVERGLQREDIFFQRCFEAACGVITTVVDRLAPRGYLRFAPDGHFIFVSFAAAFLLKLLRPDFSRIVNRTHKDQILTLVRRLIRMLGSAEIAVDDKHTPKLYSRFLAGLVSRHSTPRKKTDPNIKPFGLTTPGENGTTQIQIPGKMIMQQGTIHAHAPSSVQTSANFHVHGQYDQSSATQLASSDSRHAPPDSQGYAENVQYSSMHYNQQQQQDGQSHAPMATSGYYSSSPPGNITVSPTQHQPYMSGMDNMGMGTAVQSGGNNHVQGHNYGTEQYDDGLNGALPVPMSSDEYLASMQAISHQGWWENVMMPGFVFPGGSSGYSGQQQQQPQFGQMDVESTQGHSHPNIQSQYTADQNGHMSTYPNPSEYGYDLEG